VNRELAARRRLNRQAGRLPYMAIPRIKQICANDKWADFIEEESMVSIHRCITRYYLRLKKHKFESIRVISG
jgi:hypothetical protein